MATYKILDNSIQKILKESVSLDDEKKKQYNAKLQELFDILETEMKKQEDFKELFRQKQYVGSYFENLKIDEPDEFDVDFELIIPSYIGQLQVCVSKQPGFCQLKLKQPTAASSGKDSVRTKVKRWVDESGYLLWSKVHQWMLGVVDNALREYRSSDKKETFQISRSYSGPAVTLVVIPISQPNMKFSIDLVPVFVFHEWPTVVPKLHKYKKTMVEKKWYAVPKSKESDRDFRLSFWHQEKHMLSGKNQLKPVLKLMKKLRDDQNWKGISSYYIKTLFLWKNDTDYNWCRSLGELFIEMLKELKEYLLVKKALPFYWVSESDLLTQLKSAQKQCIGGFLQNMIADIERNLDTPNYLRKYFKIGKGNRELAMKVENSTITGAATNEEWFAYEDMESVLHAVYSPRGNKSTEGPVHLKPDKEDKTVPSTTDLAKSSGESSSSHEESHDAATTALNQSGLPIDQKTKAEKSVHDKYIEEACLSVKQVGAKPSDTNDESYLFCELLCWKLRALDADTRELAMHEINNLMFRLKNFRKQQPNMPFPQYYEEYMSERKSPISGSHGSSVSYASPAQIPSISKYTMSSERLPN